MAAPVKSEPLAADTATQTVNDGDQAVAVSTSAPLVSEDLLEEVSIDGMCGVY